MVKDNNEVDIRRGSAFAAHDGAGYKRAGCALKACDENMIGNDQCLTDLLLHSNPHVLLPQ